MVVFVERLNITPNDAESGPSPETIERLTAEIRERWSPRVRRRRRIDGCTDLSLAIQLPLTPHRKGSWGE